MLVCSVDMVHIGGTRTDNDTDMKPRPADRERILQHAYHAMPALKVCLCGLNYMESGPDLPTLHQRATFELLKVKSAIFDH